MNSTTKKIHFIGVCGSAMGSVAAMLKESGHDVTGSDNELYPPMSDYLKEAGVTVFDSFSADNITADVDLVVVGNAISRGNVELEYVLDNDIKYTSFPEIIRDFFIAGNTSIVVTGTHGKTSTSSLIAWILKSAGKDVGFLIGGIPLNFNKGFSCTKGPGGCFVVEGDEYDTAFFDKRSKFLHYKPDIAIMNNLEFDHADIFRDLDDIKRSFRHLIRIIPKNGIIIANKDDENIADVTKEVYSQLVTFAIEDTSADYTAKNIKYSPNLTEFDIIHSTETVARVTTPLKGEYSVYNVLASFAAADQLGIPIDAIKAGLATFKNVRRRLESVGEVNGIRVIDDFAHHPTAIRETIAGVKRANPESRVFALFEPKSNTSRRSVFQEELAAAFDGADRVMIGKVYNYENMAESERLDPFKLVESVRARGIDASYHPDADELASLVADIAQPGDLILTMSSGSFYGICKKILAKLSVKYK